MANTSILDLAKPAGTDKALVSVINSNSEKIDAEAGKARGNFAGTYSTSSAYAVGAYCIYQGNLYRCTTAIGSSGEAWTASHWSQVSVGEEITSLNGKLTCIDSVIAEKYTSTLAVSIKNGTGTFRNNTILYTYNDEYLMIEGAVRINSFARTGSNPGITATLPVSVETCDRYDAIMTTAAATEFATTHVAGTYFTITVSESTTNYSNSNMTIIIPRIIFKRS